MSDKNCLYFCIGMPLEKIEFCEVQSHFSFDLRLRYNFIKCASDNYLSCKYFPKRRLKNLFLSDSFVNSFDDRAKSVERLEDQLLQEE